MYKIITYDKHEFLVSDEVAKKVMTAKAQGADDVFLDGAYVACSNISGIYPDDVEDRRSQVYGVLHDGSKAIRQYGRWFDPHGSRDEHGNYEVSFDPLYYPEVSMDCVPTPSEFEKHYALLPAKERLEKMVGKDRLARRLGGRSSPTPVKDLLPKRQMLT